MFSIGHLNIRSLLKSFNDFEGVLADGGYHVFALSETWLSAGIDNNAISVNGYKVLRKDRETRAGGIALYIREGITVTTVDVSDAIEQLWVKIRLDGLSLALAVVYRPPLVNYNLFLNELEDALSIILPTVDRVVILGDFNIDMLTVTTRKSLALQDLLDSTGLYQVIEGPTRVTQSSSTLIDLILVSDRSMVSEVGVADGGSMSDHDIIYCNLKFKTPPHPPLIRTFRSFKYFQYDHFADDLYRIPFFHIFDIPDGDSKVNFFNNALCSVLEVHCPLKTCSFVRPQSPWITDTIKSMQKIRDRAYREFKATKLPQKWTFYKTMRRIVTEAIRTERRVYLELQIKSANNKWTALRKAGLFNKKQISIPGHLKNLNQLNAHFVGVGISGYDADLYNYYLNNTLYSQVFEFAEIAEANVEETINAINSNAMGYDSLNIKIIKLCCPHIIPYVRHIVNHVIETSSFPASWKISLLNPLPKINNPQRLSDLRPISILPVLSKVMEKILFEQLSKYTG
nr:uncharacterized protein LOC111422045 [Onthophagus taurus]XP_022911018.1 uncharacterized protein LOC111422045 [Onthophagus taurus]